MEVDTHQVQISNFGEPECLTLTEISLQTQAPVVRVAFAGVNPIDTKTRAGIGWAAKENADKLPWCPGYDVAGELLTADGKGSGQHVCGLIGFPFMGGAYAEHVSAPQDEWVALPDNVDLRQAAALPLAGLTASQALSRFGDLREAEEVVVLGAAGGVGHLVVQLAKQQGAKVTAISRVQNHEWLLALGADCCVDYGQPGWQALVAEHASLVIDCVGGEVGLSLVKQLLCGTDVVTLPTVTADAIIEAGDAAGCHVTGMLIQPDPARLKQLVTLLADGVIKVAVAATFPLADANLAHRQVETGHTRGKVILDCRAPATPE
ncbi:NADP-dependent oxidoreductase [Corallincola luteus]|uniref:NADP-dependent oxidoreductase n=1 Tax=Corallincola luteus TaxID=1775177 RepID=A0ABY2ASB7_9GAMM|nr:NADP-dependent oxidoreductase [Corallincola luteus]TCI05052.1 NADP-dependent oxidoreductase [Corallincola luteus]